MDAALQRTIDDLEIRRVMARYSRGIDRMMPDLVASIYWPEARDKHGTFEGSATEFVDWVMKGMTDWRCTAHFLGQSLIEIDGDTAEVETYFTAHHVRDAADGAEDVVYVGRYLDRFEKRRGEWKVGDREIIVDFRRTHAVDVEYDGGKPIPTRRSANDPSFAYTRFKGKTLA